MAIPNLIRQGEEVYVPIGFRLTPIDEEAVLKNLTKKEPMLGYPRQCMIPKINLGRYHPWRFPGDDDEDVKYFYTREEPELMQRGMRMKRVSVAGVSRERGEELILSPNASDVIAMKRSYTFEHTGGQRTTNRSQPRQ